MNERLETKDTVRHDREVIQRFVERLRNQLNMAELRVDRWPEDEEPGTAAIDAIAGPFAIEHTSVDTLPNQRRDGDWFEQALADVERISVTFRLQINVPYELVQQGSDWAKYRDALAAWITQVAPTLKDGVHQIDLLGSNIRLAAAKRSDWKPGVFLRRPVPVDATLPNRVADLIRRKMEKLAPHRTAHRTTVLLLETEDHSLMNQFVMLEAVRKGLSGKLPDALDQIWYVEAAGHECIELTAAVKDRTSVLE